MSKRSRREDQILLSMRWYCRFAAIGWRRYAFILRPIVGERILLCRKYYLPRFGVR